MEGGLHPDQLLDLALHEARDRDARPAAHHLGDVLGVDLLLQEPCPGLQLGQFLVGFLDTALEVRQLAVADGRGAGQVGVALEARRLVGAGGLLLLQLAQRVDARLLLLPVRRHAVALFPQLGQLALDALQPLTRGVVGLLLQRDPLDLQLADAPDDLVELRRHGVDLYAQLRGRLVDQVDRLVRQEPAGHVAVREHRRRHQRRVLDPHTVVDLVAFLEPAQDGDGVLDRGFAHEHGLEPALQRGVLLDGGAVLVERGGADQAQLAPGQHGLDHLPGVHGSLGRAGADDGVQLVDERDDLALGVGDLLEHRLEPLFELSPVLGPGHHGAEVERDDALALQALGHVALDDPVGQPLDDGGLAHARLTDQDRVVLGPPRQHLDHPPDLLVPADDRVELAVPGSLGEVAPVLGQRLIRLLGVGRRDPVVAPHLAQRRQERFLGHPDGVGQRQDEVLDRHVVVAEVAADLVGRLEHQPGVPGEAGLGTALGAAAGATAARAPDRPARQDRPRPGTGADGSSSRSAAGARRAGGPASAPDGWTTRHGRSPR